MYDYFGIQAKMGITKHMGGLKATKYLLEHCNVDKSKYVLVVGCGNGKSAINIARIAGCKVVGIDISEEMVKSANEKATEGVEFRVGNAEKISFPANTFDAIISESVTAFTDKRKSLPEYRRVLKKGGYLGLNEITWLEKPTKEIRGYAVRAMGGVKGESKKGWLALLKKAQFRDVSGEAYPMKKFEQFIGELQMQGFDIFKIWGRFFYYYFTDREYMKSVHKMAKDALKIPKGFMGYLGYGLYVVRK